MDGEKCTLTVDWIKEQYQKNKYSAYTCIEMFPSKTAYFPFKPSVDRIDNSKPHTPDNCVLVCIA